MHSVAQVHITMNFEIAVPNCYINIKMNSKLLPLCPHVFSSLLFSLGHSNASAVMRPISRDQE